VEDAADAFFNNKFNYSRNYAESTAVFGAASYYCISCPLMMYFASVYFFGKYMIDKYQIVHQYSKPHFAYGRRARSTTTYLLTSMVAGRVGDPIYFLYISPNILIGIMFLLVFLLSALALFLYVYRNKLFNKNSALGKQAREATGGKAKENAKQAKIDRLQEEGNSADDAGEDFMELYSPPSLETMKAKTDTLEALGSSGSSSLNPMADDNNSGSDDDEKDDDDDANDTADDTAVDNAADNDEDEDDDDENDDDEAEAVKNPMADE